MTGQHPQAPVLAAGQRIRLISMADGETVATDLGPGDEGTVTMVDGLGTVHVRWDRGGVLGLIPGADEWELA